MKYPKHRKRPNPKGSGGIGVDGYYFLKKDGARIRRARWIAATKLGRPLRWPEQVHHVNFRKLDDRPRNLVICPDTAYHLLLHARTRALSACGHADWRPCVFCKRYSDLSHLKKHGGGHAHHPACSTKIEYFKNWHKLNYSYAPRGKRPTT